MKSRLYYVLYFYTLLWWSLCFILNEVFTGEEISFVNLAINIGFLVIIGILFFISSVSFDRLNRFTYDLEEYINENLLVRVGMNFFNSGISGTLTGRGILGKFLGLSMGLEAFSGDESGFSHICVWVFLFPGVQLCLPEHYVV